MCIHYIIYLHLYTLYMYAYTYMHIFTYTHIYMLITQYIHISMWSCDLLADHCAKYMMCWVDIGLCNDCFTFDCIGWIQLPSLVNKMSVNLSVLKIFHLKIKIINWEQTLRGYIAKLKKCRFWWLLERFTKWPVSR